MTGIIKCGKKIKGRLKKIISPRIKPHVGYCRRIERVCTDKRICAMTFDDGPMLAPASPDRFSGRAMTDVLLDTLARYGAKGTFDVIGSTAENYPDRAGKINTPLWGGVAYDHYPDINCDEYAGADAAGVIIERIIREGHQLTNHGYRHLLFGKKPLVYGGREHLETFEEVVEDISRLHRLVEDKYGYTMKMSRPPHYVDSIERGITAYDAYNALGYQYLAASFDGCGWLPSKASDEETALAEEVEAMVAPLRRALEADPDALCGQIIFQKDGYNMGKRTPVAYGLEKQLELLYSYGYSVVTVDELMKESPFADIGRSDPDFDKFAALAESRAIAYTDNTLRPDGIITKGELAMLAASREGATDGRISLTRASGIGRLSPYAGAMAELCCKGVFTPETDPDSAVSEADISALEHIFAKRPTKDANGFSRRAILRCVKTDR